MLDEVGKKYEPFRVNLDSVGGVLGPTLLIFGQIWVHLKPFWDGSELFGAIEGYSGRVLAHLEQLVANFSKLGSELSQLGSKLSQLDAILGPIWAEKTYIPDTISLVPFLSCLFLLPISHDELP